MRIAELLFVVGGLAALLYPLRKSTLAIRWSWAFQKTAFMCLLVSFTISLYTMSTVWGNINWAEPQFVAIGRVLAIAAVLLAVGLLMQKPKVAAMSGLVLGAIVLVEIGSRRNSRVSW